jgi:hypothetical protein
MSLNLSGEITAVATAVLAFFAIVTAIFMIRASARGFGDNIGGSRSAPQPGAAGQDRPLKLGQDNG